MFDPQINYVNPTLGINTHYATEPELDSDAGSEHDSAGPSQVSGDMRKFTMYRGGASWAARGAWDTGFPSI
jgi:hypothetical protein